MNEVGKWFFVQVRSLDFIVWSEEDTVKCTGTVNQHSCVDWVNKKSEKLVVNLAGVSLCYSLCSILLIGPFLFQAVVTGTAYLSMLQDIIIPSPEFCFWRRMVCHHTTVM